MKKFKFTGEPGERLHPEDIVMTVFGLDFSGGKAVEVTNEKLIGKLEGNSHFTEVALEPDKQAKTLKARTPSSMNKTELAAHASNLGFTLDDSKTQALMVAELKSKIKAKAEEDDLLGVSDEGDDITGD